MSENSNNEKLEKAEEKPLETTPEEVKVEVKKEEEEANVEVKKEKSEMNLAEIIRDYCKLKDDTQIVLTPLLRKALRKMARTNQVNIEKIEKLFNDILEDKKVNMKDLPSIMHLLQELHIMYKSLKLKLKSEDIALVLKTCIQLLLMYKLDGKGMSLKDKVKMMEGLNTVIDLSIGMMDFKKKQKKLKKWFQFIPCM